MNVELIHHTPFEVAFFAGHTCVGNDRGTPFTTDTQIAEYLNRIIARGHESVIEHIVYTFTIEGISRAVLQQLARHRHISLSVLSTRYTLSKEFSLANCTRTARSMLAREGVDAESNELFTAFQKYIALLDAQRGVMPNDVLKYFLPEIVETRLMVTVNARELRHIFRLRLGTGAMMEFRQLMRAIYTALPKQHTFMYDEFIADVVLPRD